MSPLEAGPFSLTESSPYIEAGQVLLHLCGPVISANRRRELYRTIGRLPLIWLVCLPRHMFCCSARGVGSWLGVTLGLSIETPTAGNHTVSPSNSKSLEFFHCPDEMAIACTTFDDALLVACHPGSWSGIQSLEFRS